MNDELLNIRQASELLDKGHQTIRRMVKRGVLPAILDGDRLIFKRKDVERVKEEKYPEGMTHGDIAREYNVKRTTVLEQFKRLGVRPLGTHQGKNNANIYSPSTVARFALVLGWDSRPHKSQTDES